MRIGLAVTLLGLVAWDRDAAGVEIGNLAKHGALSFGLDALGGPAILWRRTRVDLFGDLSSSFTTTPRAALAAGPWLRLGPLVTAARIQVYAPFGPQWLAYGTMGVAW